MICYPHKKRMTMEHPPLEDAFPIENGDFPPAILVFTVVFVYKLVSCFRKWQNHRTSGW